MSLKDQRRIYEVHPRVATKCGNEEEYPLSQTTACKIASEAVNPHPIESAHGGYHLLSEARVAGG